MRAPLRPVNAAAVLGPPSPHSTCTRRRVMLHTQPSTNIVCYYTCWLPRRASVCMGRASEAKAGRESPRAKHHESLQPMFYIRGFGWSTLCARIDFFRGIFARHTAACAALLACLRARARGSDGLVMNEWLARHQGQEPWHQGRRLRLKASFDFGIRRPRETRHTHTYIHHDIAFGPSLWAPP